MMKRLLFALLLCASIGSAARIAEVCNAKCDMMPLHLILNTTCHQFCSDTVALLSPECDAALVSWNSSTTTDGTDASASSANVVAWIEVLVATLERVLASGDPAQAKTVLMDVVIKGFLKDFGRYDQCTAVQSAHYCPIAFQPADPSLAGLSAGVLGMCLPKSCSAVDVGAVFGELDKLVSQKTGASLSNYLVAKTTCGDQSVGWDAGAGIMVFVCFVIVILVMAATVVEALKDNDEDDSSNDKASSSEYKSMSAARTSTAWKMLDCFSLFRNIRKFGEIRSGTPTSCLDGIRTLSMCWVVMGHTLLWPLTSDLPGWSNIGELAPYYNPNALLGTFSGQAILSAEFSVDSFFFMSGFLATYIGLKKLGSKGYTAPIKMAPFMYLDRFLRLTPCYFFIVLCYTYVSPLVSSGPFWSLLDQGGCKKSWWQNLLYIQTIFDAAKYQGNDTCYGVSWYLADDMMYFYLVPFLVALALWRRTSAYITMAVVGVASIAAGFYVAGKYHLSPSPFDPTGVLYMAKYYYPPWTRISPYLIGTAFGIFWRDHQERAVAVLQDKRVQAAVWSLSFVILGSCMWGNADQLSSIPSKLYTNKAQGAFFVALAKPAWTVGLALMCMMCFARVGYWVQWFLEAPIFGYLSKLTFTIYLTHPTILYIWVRGVTGPMHYSPMNYSMYFLAVLTSSTGLAFLIHLCVEQPTSNLLAILMAPKPRPPKKETDVSRDDDDDDQDGVGLRSGVCWLPLPFEGESSFDLPALPAPPRMLALPAPAPVYNSSETNQLRERLAGPDLENGKQLGNLMIA